MINIIITNQDARDLRNILLHYSVIAAPSREAEIALHLRGDVDYAIRQNEGEEIYPN